MLRDFIKSYLEKDKSRSNKSNLLKLLISDKPKFDEINNFINFESTFRQKFYHYLNDIKHKPKCFVCGADVLWVEALSSYRETCSSKCSGSLAKYRRTSKVVSHPSLSTKEEYYNYFSSNKMKVMESSISNYYPELLPHVQEISFVDDFNQKVYCYLKGLKARPVCKICSAEVQFETFSKGFHDYCSTKCSSNSEIKKEAIKSTVRSKYGVDNIGEVTREKALETMIQKYGEHISKTEQFKKKFRDTSLERFGVEHPFKSKEVLIKIKKIYNERFGVDNPMMLTKTIQKGLQTKKDKGLIYKWSEEELKNYERYRQKVTYLSEKTYLKHIDDINPERLQRGHLTFHLDHIYPVILGFINGVDAELIADARNLQILPHDENRNKSSKTEMTLEDFYNLISK